MEFPDVGEHCSENTCKQLDFLPMKCDACKSLFCRDHIFYMKHNCSASHLKDIQVPVCPLCNQPVPVKRGQQPDIGVSDHIDNECQSDKAVKKRKVYANRCSLKGCKQKELIKVLCDSCHKNYCLRHRHTVDHECKGFQGTGRSVSKTGAAAVNRTAGSSSSQQNRPRHKPQSTPLSNIGLDLERERRDRMAARQSHQSRPNVNPSRLQAGMSEDEAMARAIQLSLAAEQQASSNQTSPQSSADKEAARLQEEEDAALARALAESEQDARGQPQQSRNQQSSGSQSKCHVS